MARYFFDHRDNDRFFRDEEGSEFSDLAAAQTEAASALAELALDVILGSERRTLCIEVCDDSGPIFGHMAKAHQRLTANIWRAA